MHGEKMYGVIWIIIYELTYIYLWSIKCYYSILDQEYKHKFQVPQLPIKIRQMSKWLLGPHHTSIQTWDAIPRHIKIAQSGTEVEGSCTTLSAI